MTLSNLVIIFAVEAAIVAFFLFFIVMMRNRQLVSAMPELIEKLSFAKLGMKKAQADEQSVVDWVNQKGGYAQILSAQIDATLAQHQSLVSEDRDILLELSPETPHERRALAVRYALLLAERAVTASLTSVDVRQAAQQNQGANLAAVDWSLLQDEYLQILDLCEVDFSAEVSAKDRALSLVRDELAAIKTHLEKVQACWRETLTQAEVKLDECLRPTSYDDVAALKINISSLNGLYTALSPVIESGEDPASLEIDLDMLASSEESEVKQEPPEAPDLSELREKIASAPNEEVRDQLMDNLTDELEKQARFVKESETCVQVMEDELSLSQKEIARLRSQLMKNMAEDGVNQAEDGAKG